MDAPALPEIRRDDVRRIRSAFPALERDLVFLENAGGSQVPIMVADRMRNYLLESYVQLGAGYELSEIATGVVDEAHRFVGHLVNASDGHVILGASSSALCQMLANAYADTLSAGASIVLAENGHEANVGPWVRLAERCGLEVRWWHINPATFETEIDDLRGLVDETTAIVAFPHVSNLLGDIVDVAAATEVAHSVGARVVVDGVAFAPHRAIDTAAWNVDWYVYSAYKVFGPHMGALYGRSDAVAELTGPNHFFIDREDVPYKFELGCANHEGCAGILGLADYLGFLLDSDPPESHAAIRRAFALITACELPLQKMLIEYLSTVPSVRIIGSTMTGEARVPTISFVHDRIPSSEIAREINASGFGIRHGHMYAYRLCRALDLDPEEGVVRVSAVHYNEPREMNALIEALSGVFRRHGS